MADLKPFLKVLLKVVSIGSDLALASDRMPINDLYIYEKCKDRNKTAHYVVIMPIVMVQLVNLLPTSRFF